MTIHPVPLGLYPSDRWGQGCNPWPNRRLKTENDLVALRSGIGINARQFDIRMQTTPFVTMGKWGDLADAP